MSKHEKHEPKPEPKPFESSADTALSAAHDRVGGITPPPEPTGRWRVSMSPGAGTFPTLVVAAGSPGEAVEAYRLTLGVVSFSNGPLTEETPDQLTEWPPK